MTAPWRPRERGRRLGGAPAGVVLALVALAAGGEAAAAVGHAFPVALERLDEWLPTLAESGLALVPISGVVDRQLPP